MSIYKNPPLTTFGGVAPSLNLLTFQCRVIVLRAPYNRPTAAGLPHDHPGRHPANVLFYAIYVPPYSLLQFLSEHDFLAGLIMNMCVELA